MRCLPATSGALLLLFAAFAHAADKVDYLKQIKPLLAKRCVSCHGPLRRKGGLRLDAAKLIRKGGDSGAAIVPGKPDDGLLLDALAGKGGMTRMPAEGEPLKPAEIALIRRWVQEGAVAPNDEPIAADPRDHWAYRVPKRPPVPKSKFTHPIDAFLAVQREKHGLKPQPPTAKHILLRRVYLDLIGLPPTPDEVQAFLKDKSPDAYEKVVDRLLQSPRYGERWGRHWMDVWRYSDWYGYRAQLRNSARHIWRWRDYIVESLNKDRPYNEMIVDMLAADEHTPTDRDRLRATGFLARQYYIFNRDLWMDSAIEHTSKAFLGLTLNCARCHEHKYDPIEHREYYRFRAIFEPYLVRTDRVPGQPDVNKNGLALAYDGKPDAKTYVYERGNDKYPDKEHPVTPAVPGFLSNGEFTCKTVQLPAAAWYPGMRPYIRKELLAKANAAIAAKRQAVTRAERRLQTVRRNAKRKAVKPAAVATKPARVKLKPFLVDDFAKATPTVWTAGPGKWKYADGRLTQSAIAKSRQYLRTRANHPQDFTAVFRFRTTGGETYKSVGISFDDDAKGNFETVYLSAYAQGPKVQVSHTRGGKATYPPSGAKRLPVKLGVEQELRIDVRDRLLNVTVNGKRQLVYTLPNARRGGKLSLWTFDATAEFLRVEVTPLSPSAQLAGKPTGPPRPVTSLQAAETALRLAKLELQVAESELQSLQARIKADDSRYANPPLRDAQALIRAASRAEKLAKLHSAKAALLRAERNRMRLPNGPIEELLKDLPPVEKKTLVAAQAALKKDDGKYTPLTKTYPETSTGRRLALAKWIANDKNPLTARVAVNHIWMRHFGKPLVSTVFDFGRNGKRPTHPQLLDWLAVEFMGGSRVEGPGSRGKSADTTHQIRNPQSAIRNRSAWSMKHLHRLIVTSNAYKMSSSAKGAAATNLQSDPDNRYLWRMNSRRMEGEAVRDSVLAVSGQLDLTMGGPELDQKLGQTTFRRSLYYRHAPEKLVPFLEIFDSANPRDCYRRDETVVPQQSLAMINSTLVLEQSRRLATLLNKRTGTDPNTDAAFINALFLRVLSRKPTATEKTTCQSFLAAQTKRLSKPKSLSTFTGGPKVKTPPAGDPRLRARENLAQVLLNHNEFLTIR